MVPAQLSDRHTRSDTRPRPTQPRLVGKPSTANQYTATTHTTSTPSAPARTAGSAAASTGTTKPGRAATTSTARTAGTTTTSTRSAATAATGSKAARTNTSTTARPAEKERHRPHRSGCGCYPTRITTSRTTSRPARHRPSGVQELADRHPNVRHCYQHERPSPRATRTGRPAASAAPWATGQPSPGLARRTMAARLGQWTATSGATIWEPGYVLVE